MPRHETPSPRPTAAGASAGDANALPTAAFAFPTFIRDEVLRLETRRLWLRWPTPGDAAALAEIAAVATCARGTRWPLAWDGRAAFAPQLIERMRGANGAGEAWLLAIAEKASPGHLLGLVGIDAGGDTDGVPRLGFRLDVRRQGYGLMSEAVRAQMAAAFAYAGLERVRPDNALRGIGARRVLEKAGFRWIGRQHEGPAAIHHEAYRADWPARPLLVRSGGAGPGGAVAQVHAA